MRRRYLCKRCVADEMPCELSEEAAKLVETENATTDVIATKSATKSVTRTATKTATRNGTVTGKENVTADRIELTEAAADGIGREAPALTVR